ncbi:hypothetical protein ES702_02733 [subsurface metagenome]
MMISRFPKNCRGALKPKEKSEGILFKSKIEVRAKNARSKVFEVLTFFFRLLKIFKRKSRERENKKMLKLAAWVNTPWDQKVEERAKTRLPKIAGSQAR